MLACRCLAPSPTPVTGPSFGTCRSLTCLRPSMCTRAQWSVFPALAGTLDFSKYLHNLALIQGSNHPRSVSPWSPQRSGLRPSVDPAIDPHTLYPCTRRCRNGLWMEHMLILSGHSRPCPGPLLFTFYLTSVTMLLNELGANPPAVTED